MIVMETKFNFNSQICTTREQSDLLLALGLNKETADCALLPLTDEVTSVLVKPSTNDIKFTIPAWSLGRLIKLMPRTAIMHTQEGDTRIDIDMYAIEILVSDDPIAEAVSIIEWLIKEGNFNKEYLIKITSQGNTSTRSVWMIKNGVL